jgi:hypothetical protein
VSDLIDRGSFLVGLALQFAATIPVYLFLPDSIREPIRSGFLRVRKFVRNPRMVLKVTTRLDLRGPYVSMPERHRQRATVGDASSPDAKQSVSIPGTSDGSSMEYLYHVGNTYCCLGYPMPMLTVRFSEGDWKTLVRAKLSASQIAGAELNWHDALLLIVAAYNKRDQGGGPERWHRAASGR